MKLSGKKTKTTMKPKIISTSSVYSIEDLFSLFKGENNIGRYKTIEEYTGIPAQTVQQFFYRNRIPAHYWQRMLWGCNKAGIHMTLENLYQISYPEGDSGMPTDRRAVAEQKEKDQAVWRQEEIDALENLAARKSAH